MHSINIENKVCISLDDVIQNGPWNKARLQTMEYSSDIDCVINEVIFSYLWRVLEGSTRRGIGDAVHKQIRRVSALCKDSALGALRG